LQLRSWGELAKNPLVSQLLLLTTLLTSGQFLVFTFLAPLLKQLTGATADHVGLVFALSGVMGFTGNVIASRIVGTVGAYRTAQLATTALALGALIFALGAGLHSFVVIALSLTVWGLGFASSNSMQQARLVAAAPPLAGASVALNTSFLYVGQAAGSALGGALFAASQPLAMGYAALAFILLGAGVLLRTAPSELVLSRAT
jgi:predicted MFS family arabinose efflux permease